jgi:AraC family transcriptional regulator of adaptative response / DNA-3-methyladenine glycosylase II
MPTLTRDEMLARFHARDPACERAFVVGVVTTGIYCVPTCTARKPRAENVRFFASLDAARQAGLRACKRCRPDQVHAGLAPDEADRLTLEDAVRTLRAAPGDVPDVSALARSAGCGVTKLGELVRRHFHATPRALIARARTNHARRALLTTRRPLLDVALDAGFESPSAFHENFRAATGLAPGDYRAMADARAFEMHLPAGYPVDHLLRSIGRDPDGRTERVRGTTLARALRLDGRPALALVDLADGRARVRLEARRALAPREVGAAHEALLRLFGLTLDPAPFERRARRDALIRRLVEPRRGLRIPQTPNAFEGLVWAVVGQQVNLAFAFTCRNRLIDLAGARAGGGLVAHPTPADVAGLDHADLTRLQFSRRKAEYVIDTARAIAAGELDLERLGDGSATAAERALLAVRGIGRWSARYVLMRSFGFADCVPVGDAGLVNALQRFHALDARPGPDETEALMARYAPHRSLAAFHLWKTLGDPA